MRKRSWRISVELFLPLCVLVVALAVLRAGMSRVDFHGDEGRAIWLTRYFDLLFIRHDLANPEWGDNYWTHDHPFLTPYVIGAWLSARGYDLHGVPPPYDWNLSAEKNHRDGRVPDDALLAEARAPMVFIAACAIVLLYLLGRVLGGAVAGLIAAALGVASPLDQKFLVRAVSDAPLVFFLLLGLLLGVLGMRRGRGGGLPIGWAAALGLALGLGLETKLTSLLSLVAILVWGALMAIMAAGRGGPERIRAAWAAGRGWSLALLVALGVYVGSDPHLYPNPLLHTAHRFQQRVEDTELQESMAPREVVSSLPDRVRYVIDGSLVKETATGSRGLPLEAVLVIVGAAVLLARSRRVWQRSGRIPAEGLVLVTALLYFVGVSAGLFLGRPRYLVPTLLLGTLLSGVGLSATIRQLAGLGIFIKSREPVAQGTAPRA
jgi:Dolichyl-phosphate-mannose-protein mannosyltransferase